jgi:hypothetical protein
VVVMGFSELPDKNTKGKILRVKQGYNPNSSSMGSIVFSLPAALLAVTVGFGVVSGIIMSAFIRRVEKNGESDEDMVSKKTEKQEG